MPEPTTYRRTLTMKGARIQILIDAAPFDPKKHRYRRNADNGVEMDGYRTFGTDEIPPKAHNVITRLEVQWNGRRVPIPPHVWKHMVNAPVTDGLNTVNGNIVVRPSDEGEALLLSLSGGEAAGSFERWWVIRRDGVAAVFTQGPE